VRRTISAGGDYNWEYKPVRKGVYRMRAITARTATHSAGESVWRSFTVT
jgi:hypothetical protein